MEWRILANQEIRQAIENGFDPTISNFEVSTDVSLETFRLILQGLWEKIQNGLTLADIENVLFFILFIRFVILAIRYNLKTSFYITCIGLFAEIFSVYYFQSFVLIPQTESYTNYVDSNLILQINILNGVIACVVLTHIGIILFGLFHAIWGQYFYFPFFVENTELHIGPRPKNSIYSGGNTAWQDSEEKNVNRLFPKLWFGWFGRGSKNQFQFGRNLIKLMKKFLKKLKKQFRK